MLQVHLSSPFSQSIFSPLTLSYSMLQVFLRDTYGINKTLSIGHMADGTTADFTTYTKSALRVLEKKILQIVDPSRLPNEEALNKAIEETFSKYNPDEKMLKVLQHSSHHFLRFPLPLLSPSSYFSFLFHFIILF